ncbi:MAG: hypothetical protein V4443_07270 [Pseudomonadota bacterium]
MNKYFLHFALGIFLAGCGGGSSSTATLSGKVIDGYVTGAAVCLDLNNNQVCDPGEPASTANDGSYTLNTTGLSDEEIAAAFILAYVPVTAQDSGDNGKTLAQLGKPAVTLLAPTRLASPIAVTSYTTLVSQQMINSAGTVLEWCEPFWWCSLLHRMMTSPAKSMAQAQSTLRSQLLLADDVDLMQDYIANDVPAQVRNTATAIAMALGDTQETINARNPGDTAQQRFSTAVTLLSVNIGKILKNNNLAAARAIPPTALNVASALLDSNVIPAATISVFPAVITVGESATLTWASTVATVCTATGGWSGTPALSGTMQIKPSSPGNNSYTLRCVDNDAYTGGNGFAVKTATLAVYPAGYSSYHP